jgi:nucleotide-binding universal stress UspA family protein
VVVIGAQLYVHFNWMTRQNLFLTTTGVILYLLKSELEGRGMTILTGADTAEIIEQDGRVGGVRLKDGTEIPADLVVMGSEHPDSLREFLVGSNADRIVRRSPVSVLVVRA